MTDVFWNKSTPGVAQGDLPRSYLPVRIQGAAADGSQDIFAQVPLPLPGSPGQSAYQIWLGLGNTGTPADFINSLAGAITAAAIVAALGFTPIDPSNAAAINSAMSVWMGSLPTDAPANPGQWWNNGGIPTRTS